MVKKKKPIPGATKIYEFDACGCEIYKKLTGEYIVVHCDKEKTTELKAEKELLDYMYEAGLVHDHDDDGEGRDPSLTLDELGKTIAEACDKSSFAHYNISSLTLLERLQVKMTDEGATRFPGVKVTKGKAYDVIGYGTSPAFGIMFVIVTDDDKLFDFPSFFAKVSKNK